MGVGEADAELVSSTVDNFIRNSLGDVLQKSLVEFIKWATQTASEQQLEEITGKILNFEVTNLLEFVKRFAEVFETPCPQGFDKSKNYMVTLHDTTCGIVIPNGEEDIESLAVALTLSTLPKLLFGNGSCGNLKCQGNDCKEKVADQNKIIELAV